MEEEIIINLEQLRKASRKLVELSSDQVDRLLNALAKKVEKEMDSLIIENQKDLDRMNPQDPKYDRLLLNKERIYGIAGDIRKLTKLPSPLGKVLVSKNLDNGLQLQKVTVPIGVICIVYESRPNVTLDVFSICFKSGNACVLKGSQEAEYSNRYIVRMIRELLQKHRLPISVYLTPAKREALQPVLNADKLIDLVIPRGGQGLIDFVRKNSRVPVIETGAGIVHTYVDDSADIAKAKNIIKNAKTRRVSVCNALDTLIIHRNRLRDLPYLCEGLDQEFNLTIYADESSYTVLSGHYEDELLQKATYQEFGTEFLSMKMAIKTVDELDEAIDHISEYSSKHSEAIIAEDQHTLDRFQKSVDAAVVYTNCSTAFTDGAQFGMGAEIGISTQKMHARGPMALEELTSYKWLVMGDGQTRP